MMVNEQLSEIQINHEYTKYVITRTYIVINDFLSIYSQKCGFFRLLLGKHCHVQKPPKPNIVFMAIFGLVCMSKV